MANVPNLNVNDGQPCTHAVSVKSGHGAHPGGGDAPAMPPPDSDHFEMPDGPDDECAE